MDIMQTVLGNVLNVFKDIDPSTIWKKVFADEEFKTTILDWIRQEQLFKEGIDANENVIGYYSAFTEMLNPEKAQGSPYTLFDTGEFYRSMNIVVEKDFIDVDSNPIKIDENGKETNLIEAYGEDILGLTKEHKEKLANELKERFVKEILKLL